MLFYLGLQKNNWFIRIYSGCQISNQGIYDVFFQFFGIVRSGDGVQINNAKHAFIFFLKRDPLLYCPQIVSQMQASCWADATEYPHNLKFKMINLKTIA